MNYQRHTEYYKVLTHPTRLAILDILRGSEECVCHMEAVLGLRQAYISQQLMVLRDAGLLDDRREGWNIFYRVMKPEIYQVIDAMGILCNDLEDASGKSSRNAKNCTCPKCNIASESLSSEPALMSDQIEIKDK